jgi:cysteinyl-tRNA synthetase
MPAILETIQALAERDYAYAPGNGDVYYRARRFSGYGRLSGRSFEDAESQEPASGFKEDPADFALWKAAKPGEPAWPSPWGPGRPGWHIECSAMARRHLGEQIDIHGGGMDLLFPHHENEIAQSEAACGCHPFSRYWIHNGMLRVNGEKMSKSLGNYVGLDDFLARYDADVLRFLILSSHYRKPVNYTEDAIAGSARGLERLWGALRPARPTGMHLADAERLALAASSASTEFETAMDDDFGTPGALAALFALCTEINRARDAGVDLETMELAQASLIGLAAILGLDLPAGAAAAGAQTGASDGLADGLMSLVVDLRAQARAARDFAASDAIRDRLASLGVELVDEPSGTGWRRAAPGG